MKLRLHLQQMRDAVDPVTGDRLSAGERVSWAVQRVIRRWAFLGVIQLVTLVCWLTRNDGVLLWWNLAASDFAIVMEFLIGLAMLGQTMRDALVTRTVLKMEREHGEMLADVRAVLREQTALLCELLPERPTMVLPALDASPRQ